MAIEVGGLGPWCNRGVHGPPLAGAQVLVDGHGCARTECAVGFARRRPLQRSQAHAGAAASAPVPRPGRRGGGDHPASARATRADLPGPGAPGDLRAARKSLRTAAPDGRVRARGPCPPGPARRRRGRARRAVPGRRVPPGRRGQGPAARRPRRRALHRPARRPLQPLARHALPHAHGRKRRRAGHDPDRRGHDPRPGGQPPDPAGGARWRRRHVRRVGSARQPDPLHGHRVRVRRPAGPPLASQGGPGQPGAPRRLSLESPADALGQPGRGTSPGAAGARSARPGGRRGPPHGGDHPGRRTRLAQRGGERRGGDRRRRAGVGPGPPRRALLGRFRADDRGAAGGHSPRRRLGGGRLRHDGDEPDRLRVPGRARRERRARARRPERDHPARAARAGSRRDRGARRGRATPASRCRPAPSCSRR